MKERRAKAGISIYEEKLANIREIQISNEVKHNEIKKKAMRLENKLPHLFAKADLKGQLKQVAILLKGLKQEESQYIERMYPAERNN
jgi:hypothetical protein